jgi:hypothetical protein
MEVIFGVTAEKNAIPSWQLASVNVGKKGTISQSWAKTLYKEGRQCLVIIDYLLNKVYSKQVCHLFTKRSHHRNISAILITQNLFHQGRYLHGQYL